MEDLPLPANTATFDQQPIGNSTKLAVDEYPANFDPTKIQATQQPLPIGKRLGSKVWKIRKQALEQLLRIVSNQNHKQFVEHEAIIVKSLSDANVQCQLISAKILNEYLEKAGSYEGDCKAVLKSVIEKLMTIEKQEVQNVAMQIIFWMLDHGEQESIVNQLNDYLLNKNPKIVSSSMKVIQTLVSNYGLKKFLNLQIFTKHLKLLTESVRPVAKTASVQMYKQIYKWMGENCFSEFIIHRQVKDEVAKWVKTYQMQPMQIKRGLKKGEQGKRVNAMQEQEQNDTPVDILHHYDSRWVETVLEIKKWQQKKQHLQQFIKKTKVKCIVPRETYHYITLIKRLFSQNNINLLQCGFKIVMNLSRGLKKSFSGPCKAFLSYVYLKLKDNKAMIVDETLTTLKAMTYSINLEDMQQQIKAGLKDKSPQMRLNTLKLLKQLSSNKKQPKTTRILKSLLDILIALTNDSASNVRDIALSVLCKIKQHHGMVFFEDKLESMPPKKVTQIRSTATVGGNEQHVGASTRIQIEQPVMIMQSKMSSSSSSLNQNMNNGKTIKINKLPANKCSNPKKSSQPSYCQAYISTAKPQQSRISFASTGQSHHQQQNRYYVQSNNTQTNLQTIHEEKIQYNNRSQQQQLQEIRNQQWPVVPSPGHVLRLLRLFSKLGQPFATLATPFKLKLSHFDILENCDNNFMVQNSDLLLKWSLWRIQIQNPQIIQKITSVVIHLIFLLKTTITDSQTLLVLSILSNLLQSDFSKNDMLICINRSIIEISEFLRQKTFNFWITTLKQNNSNSQFCQKILMLIKTTFQNQQFNSSEIVSMARVEAVVRSKKFVQFLFSKKNKEFLKVAGFNNEQFQKSEQRQLLRLGGPQFSINTKVDEKVHYFQIFRKVSHQSIQQIKQLQQSYSPSMVMNLHIKIMDTIMLPYLRLELPFINIYNYFKLLALRITMLCDPKSGDGENITPYLRSLIRLLMFFLIDLSQSKIDNKDEMMKCINKMLLVLLDTMPAEHLLQVMTMLLKYSVKNDLIKKLNQLLIKCIAKATRGPSFNQKAQKNVKMLFNFFISLIQQQVNISEGQVMVKAIIGLFGQLIKNFRQLCLQIVVEKLNQYNGVWKNKEIQNLFVHFVGFINIGTQGHQQVAAITNNAPRLVAKNEQMRPDQNYQSMSNLSQPAYVTQNMQRDSSAIKPNHFSFINSTQLPHQPLSNTKVRETTNIFKNKIQNLTHNIDNIKTMINHPSASLDLNVVDLASNNNQATHKINMNDRKKLQFTQNLHQSFEELIKMRNQGFTGMTQTQELRGSSEQQHSL